MNLSEHWTRYCRRSVSRTQCAPLLVAPLVAIIAAIVIWHHQIWVVLTWLAIVAMAAALASVAGLAAYGSIVLVRRLNARRAPVVDPATSDIIAQVGPDRYRLADSGVEKVTP